MKNVKVRFTVMTNNNVYYATSHRAKAAFLENNDFVVSRDWDIETVSISERNKAEKCGRGVYYIPE